MSAPSWVTADMSEMSCGCWRLFSWQWCSMVCQSGLHLGPLGNNLWQTRQGPYIKVRPHVLQCAKLHDRHSVIQNVSNGPFNVMCYCCIFHVFTNKNNVSCKWLTSGETIVRSTVRVYEMYDNVSGLQQLKGAIFPQVNFLKLSPFYFPPVKMYS